MSLAPYALSVHHFISSVGADAGFASIIGLALLVLLYFAQARETSTLREQAETAAQRVAQLESRLAHAAAQSAAAARAAAAAPLPPGVQPPPATVAAAGRQPGLGAAAAFAPAPPAGVAAPPLSAATKLIPTPVPVGAAGVAAAGMAGAGGVTVAGGGAAVAGGAPARPVVPPAGTVPPAATGVPPVAALSSFSAPTTPPPLDPSTTPRPATAAGGAVGTNGTGDHPLVPPPFSPRQPVQIHSGGGSDRMLGDLSSGGSERSSSDLTRVLTALAAVAVVAAIVIVLLSVTSGGTSNHNASRNPPASNAPKTSHHAPTTAKLTPVNPATVTVSVLNGTAVYHLADAIATQLGADGFQEGTVTNAATQTQTMTTVQYAPGDQREAAAVATALKLSSSAVQQMTPTTQQLGCPAGSSCSVVVTVGADLANTQTQTTTTP